MLLSKFVCDSILMMDFFLETIYHFKGLSIYFT